MKRVTWYDLVCEFKRQIHLQRLTPVAEELFKSSWPLRALAAKCLPGDTGQQVSVERPVLKALWKHFRLFLSDQPFLSMTGQRERQSLKAQLIFT